MASSGLDVFDTTLQKTNELLKNIEDNFGWEGRRHQSYQALRAVLHALRDRLPIDDAVNFAAQLPLLIKGIFYDNWSSEDVPVRMNEQEFLDRVRQDFTFDTGGGTKYLVRVVMNEVLNTMDVGERKKLIRMLPRDIGELLQ